MDLGSQERILGIVNGREDDRPVVVLLGAPDAESSELAGITVTIGDPTYAGALAGVQLGLPVYHVLEDAVREASDADAYEQQIALMGDVLEVGDIRAAMSRVREQAAG